MIGNLLIENIDEYITFRNKSSDESNYIPHITKQEALELINELSYIVIKDNRIIGELLLTIEEDIIHIDIISILEQYQNKNIGKQLIEKAIEIAKKKIIVTIYNLE